MLKRGVERKVGFTISRPLLYDTAKHQTILPTLYLCKINWNTFDSDLWLSPCKDGQKLMCSACSGHSDYVTPPTLPSLSPHSSSLLPFLAVSSHWVLPPTTIPFGCLLQGVERRGRGEPCSSASQLKLKLILTDQHDVFYYKRDLLFALC